jgi:hypothetical protein
MSHVNPARSLKSKMAGALVLALVVFGAGQVSSADAATAGGWTGWTKNPATGCMTAAQVPFLSNGQVMANVEVYCPGPTWLTIRGRLRSDRTLTDTTVKTVGCWADDTCPFLHPGGALYWTAICPKTSGRVTHGYHSDVIIYPGTQSFKLTGSTSGSTTLSPYCGA